MATRRSASAPLTETAQFEQTTTGGRTVMDRRLTPEEAAAQDATNAAKLAAARAARFGA